MIFNFAVDPEKVFEVQQKLLDFSDGMNKAFDSAFDASVKETGRRSQREIKTFVSIVRSKDAYIQAVPGLADRYLGREGNIKLIDRAVPLRAFKARQTPEGVEVQLTSAGISTQTFKGAFGPKIAKLGGNIYRRAGKKRFPIVKIADLNVSKIEGVDSKFRESVKQYKVTMVKRLEREKQKLIQQYGRATVYVASQT